ncbi:MAG TPA: hypothetical protein VFI08_06220 [Spirochaetia bacterium]|nr:hypothetical protein [Spirochaetia bacterium]
MRTHRLLAAAAVFAAVFVLPASSDSFVPLPPPSSPQGPPNGVLEADSTGSGTTDYRAYYDSRGHLVREEMDYAHKGRMDTFWYYKNGLLDRVEIDTKGTGKVDLWVYLLEGKYIQRYERDTTGSGKPDVVKVFGTN